MLESAQELTDYLSGKPIIPQSEYDVALIRYATRVNDKYLFTGITKDIPEQKNEIIHRIAERRDTRLINKMHGPGNRVF